MNRLQPFKKIQASVGLWALLLAIVPLAALGTAPAHAVTVLTLADTDALAFDRAKSTNIKGTGTAAGDIVLYRSVGAFGGTSVDAVVTTVAIPSGSISNYDNPGSAQTTGGYLNNFQLNTVGGSVQMQFDFYVSGSYTVPGSGTSVILQNVKITSIDLDSSGTNGYQYSDFTGFQTYSMTSDTNLIVQPLAAGAGARFQAGKTGARSSVPQDQVLIKYTTVSSLKVTFGNVVAGQTNYFGLVFGGWPGTGTPIEYPNVFNTPPTSTDITQYVPASASTVVPKSSFGSFSDVDNNPFVSVKIATLPGAGAVLQLNNANVTVGQIITTADIDAGKLKVVTTSLAGNVTTTFNVYDGQDYSTSTNTLTFVPAANSQVIRFSAPGSQVPGVTLASGAIATSGLPVTLTSNTPGICTVSGLDINTIANGTCEITATQAGNSTYGAATPVTVTFPVNSGTSQTITFNNPGTQTVGTPSTSAPTATSGLPVTLTSLTPTVCTVSGFTITYLSAGTCTIVASQAGNITYAPATNVTQSFTVNAPAAAALPIAARTAGVGFVNGSSALNMFGYLDMNGNPNGLTYQFCYSRSSTVNSSGALTGGSSTLYCLAASSTYSNSTWSNQTSTLAAGTTNDAMVKTANISYGSRSTLSSSRTYYYQVLAYPTNSPNSKVYGSVLVIKPTLPYAYTSDPTVPTTTSATLNGSVNTDVQTTVVSYCWTTSFRTLTTAGNLDCTLTGTARSSVLSGSVGSYLASPLAISNLTPNTTYYYQIVAARTSSGVTTTYYANILKFTTSALAPSAVTTQPTAVGSSSATLNGSVLSQGPSTNAQFCWGTSATLTGCTLVTATPSTASGNGATGISYNLTGLTAGTRYYYRAVATRTGSATQYTGAIVSFMPGAPIATTLAASGVTSAGAATLNGYSSITGNLSTSVFFCYGTSSATDSATGKISTCTVEAAETPTVTSSSGAKKTLSGLATNTTYYFQIYDTNTAGSSYGSVLTFITSAAPSVTTVNADSVTATTGNLKGTITSNGAPTDGSFCLSTSNTLDPDSGVLLNCINTIYKVVTVPGSGTGVAFNLYFNNLTSNTTYYFQANAENTRGTVSGSVLSFSTSALPIATTAAATGVNANGATINGLAAANTGTATTVVLCYSTDSSVDAYGKMTNVVSNPNCVNQTTSLTGNTVNSYSRTIASGLSSNTIYYFQIQATNGANSAYGAVLNFTTGAATVTTESATAITATSATIAGTANKQTDSSVTAYMCLSTSPAVDGNGALSCNADVQATPTSITSTGNIAVSYSTTRTLSGGTTYYYQTVVNSTNLSASGAPALGTIKSFTTNPIVTFNGNGSTSGSTASQNAAVGTSANLNANGYSRSRYTFAGWGTTPETTTVAYSGGASFTFNSNTTLYAIWTFNGYIVSFNANGGTGSLADQMRTTSGSLTSISTSITYTNFTFGGWSRTPGGSLAFADGATYDFAADMQLYAIWTSTGHIIRFISNGGSGTMSPQSISGSGALKANSFVAAPGYTFSGWSETSTSTTVEYTDSATITASRDFTLYAIWFTANKVVSFNNNGGSGVIANQIAATPTNLTANSGQMSRSGYTFLGWSETSTATTVQFADGANFAFNRDIYLYALWASRVTYDGNGSDAGTVPTDGTYYYDGQAATIAGLTGFTKTDLNLIGWAETPKIDANTRIYRSGTISMAGNITLYAVWSARLTYTAPDSTGGSVPVDSTDYIPGSQVAVVDAPGLTKTDWSFLGWSDGSQDYHVVDNDMVTLDHNVTVHAIWSTSLYQFTITYDDNLPAGSISSQTGYTAATVRLNANPFTNTGYVFAGWSLDETATVKAYSDRDSVSVNADGFGLYLYAMWTPAPVSSGGGSGGGGGSSAPAEPTPTPKQTTPTKPVLKPVISGTLTTIVSPKAIAPNSIVILKQVVKITVPSTLSVQSVTVNGTKTTPTSTSTVDSGTAQVVSTISRVVVGPEDNVKVNATTATGEKVQGTVAIEKVDPFTLANVNFDFASAKLTPAAKKILDKVAAAVVDHGFNSITLVGHTDVITSATYSNQALSDARAAAVNAYLAAKLKGTAVEVKTVGRAATEPVIAKTDATSRAINRRVEIAVATK